MRPIGRRRVFTKYLAIAGLTLLHLAMAQVLDFLFNPGSMNSGKKLGRSMNALILQKSK